MSRLLFAAARGARIQWQDSSSAWKDAHHVWPRITAPYRIHPDDEHLQYGPISSALREDAEIAPAFYFDSRISEESSYAIAKARKSGLYDMADELHRSLFLLILAESLADGGL